MRIQFVPFPAPSHLSLVVPLAWAFQNAGHDVRVVVPPNAVELVTTTGLVAIPYGGPVDLGLPIAEMTWLSQISGLDSDGSYRDEELRKLLLAPMVMHYGADMLKETMAELIEITRSWQADLVVWDTMATYAAVVARVTGAASARLLWSLDHLARMRAAFRERKARDGVEDSIEILTKSWLEPHGKTFDESAVLGDWTISPVPILGAGSTEMPCVTVRQFAFSHVHEAPPPWVLEPLSRPRVCLTLGRSVRDVRDSDNYGIRVEDLFEAVTDLDVDVVATLTSEQLPENVKVPDNVRLVDYVPINLLMSTCSAVIHHSGGTTMMAAFWHQVPQVIIPPNASGDAYLAQATSDEGAALIIPAAELTPGKLRTALTRVLDEPSFAEAARRIRAGTLSLPTPNEAIPILERLTVEAISAHRA